MSPLRLNDEDAARLRALVLLQRYKEVMHLLGRRADGSANPPRRVEVREVAERQAAAGAAYVRDVRSRMRAFGVGDTLERYTLTILALHRARPSDLAYDLELSPAGVTSLLDRLEGLGLVVRESGVLDSDLRAVLVELTPRGRGRRAPCSGPSPLTREPCSMPSSRPSATMTTSRPRPADGRRR